MSGEFDTELYKAIKQLKPQLLSTTDMEDLLSLFNTTHNHAIRNCIALIFSEAGYNEAVPFIIKKINEKELYKRNGTLVFALGELDSLAYFTDIIGIVCTQGYEARVTARVIVRNYLNFISDETKTQALRVLNEYLLNTPEEAEYQNSKLHFIEATIDLLEKPAQ